MAFSGASTRDAIKHRAVVWAEAMQNDDPSRACQQTKERREGFTCLEMPQPASGCPVPAPEPIPARKPREQVGPIERMEARVTVRVRPQDKSTEGRGYLIFRRYGRQWLIDFWRYHGHRNRHPYGGGALSSRFFLDVCERADFG